MQRIDLSPFEIQLFLEVARSRSFVGTAQAAGLTQPSVSRAIGRIEERIGARLFDRGSRHVDLTPQGAAFLPIARRIVHDLTTSMDEVAQQLAGESGHVAIAALPSAAVVLLPAAIRALMAEMPRATVQVADTYLSNVATAVAEGEVDLGIAVEPDPALRLDFTPICEDRLVAVLPADHPLAARKSLDWADLRDAPFIAMREMTSVRALTDRAFGADAPPPAFQAAHPATAGALVEAGLGVTALPEMTMRLIVATDVAIRPLTGPVLSRTMGLMARRGRTLSPVAAQLARILKADAMTHLAKPS